jgi:hypothetical protein
VPSLHELAGAQWKSQQTWHILSEDVIVDGIDELGVLLYSHARAPSALSRAQEHPDTVRYTERAADRFRDFWRQPLIRLRLPLLTDANDPREAPNARSHASGWDLACAATTF